MFFDRLNERNAMVSRLCLLTIVVVNTCIDLKELRKGNQYYTALLGILARLIEVARIKP
jgi:hypothetical protein